MRYSQVIAFLSAAENGSIRAAARQTNLSQPALSQMIRRLEEDLGVLLLDRSVRGVRLTSYGRVLQVRAKLIRAEFERAHMDIAQMKGSQEGHVAIGLITSISLLAAPRAIRAFKRKYPRVRVSINDQFYNNTLAALRDSTIDFAIGPGFASDHPQIKSEFLFETEFVALGRKDHPKARSRRHPLPISFKLAATDAGERRNHDIAPRAVTSTGLGERASGHRSAGEHQARSVLYVYECRFSFDAGSRVSRERIPCIRTGAIKNLNRTF
jgi:DNA-binding transcriptional LysR family regulator